MEPIEILYETPELVVCIKPTGVLSQTGKPGEANMVSLLQAQLGGEMFPVHRLDREVGGVMVYARTARSAAALARQIQQGTMGKEYLAVLLGRPEEPEGLLTDLLFHDRQRNKTYVVQRPRKGVKEARLKYRVLEERDGRTLVQVRLYTGRTHQIRVQFASRGLPLAGDGRYGGGKGALALWSVGLTMELPGKGMRRFTCLPEGLGEFRLEEVPAPLEK